MGRRGPKAKHEINPSRGVTPLPPAGLTDAQAAMWRRVLDSEPSHFFDSEARLHLLRLYVEHATTRAALQDLINKTDVETIADPEGAAVFERMLRRRDAESKLLISLATRMRLTNQSRYAPHVAEAAARNDLGAGRKRPWDDPHDLLARPD